MGLYGTFGEFRPDQTSGSSVPSVTVRQPPAPPQPENTGAAGWVPTPPPTNSPNSFQPNGGIAIPGNWNMGEGTPAANAGRAEADQGKPTDTAMAGYRGAVSPNGGMQLGGARAPAAPQAQQAPMRPPVDLNDPRNAALAGYR